MLQKERDVYDVLKNLHIEYEKYEHMPVYTIEEAQTLNMSIKGMQCKNLFLRNRKGNQHYLVVVEESKRVDLKSLSKNIGSTPLSFASEERLGKYLNLSKGAVTPFGLIYDTKKEVKVLIDKQCLEAQEICFHPNVNTVTLCIKYKGFEKFLQWCKNDIQYVDI